MKDAYYFPHDYHARNDPKLEELFLKMGCEGRGIYWTLIEMLYENKGYLPYDKLDYYTNALRTQSERIATILNDYGLFKNDGKVFWSESCLNRLKHLEEKREKARQSSFKRWGKNANAMPSECERNAIKESKVKESKVNNKSIVTSTSFLDTLKNNLAYKHIDVAQELAKMDAWLLVHKGRKKTPKFVVAWLNRIDKPLEPESKKSGGAEARELK